MSLTKVTYSMINGAVANVLDYGAVGDGATNNTTAIQAAMNSGASAIYFPDGTYLSDEITVPSTVHKIFGTGTFKQRTTNTKLMTFTSITTIVVDGLSFAGNYSYPQYTQSSSNTALTFTSCTDVKIVNCSFSNLQFIGIWIVNSDYVIISNNRMKYVGNPIVLRGSNYVTITGNILTDTICDKSVFVIGIACESTDGHAYGICSYVTIDNNIVTGYIQAQGIMAHSLTNGTISNNVVTDAVIGISLNPYNSTDDISNVTISGNSVYCPTATTLPSYTGGAACIVVQAGGSTPDISTVTISGNTLINGNRAALGNNQGSIQIGYTIGVCITGNTIQNFYGNGIVLTENEENILITGNIFRDGFEISGGTLNGILSLGSPKGMVCGNTFQNINSTAGTAYTIRSDSVGALYIGDNYVYNVESLGIGFQNTASNNRILTLSGTETSVDLSNVDTVVFQQSAPTTVSYFTGVVPYKRYVFYFNNGNTTIDRTSAYLNGGTNITTSQYDVVEVFGRTGTTIVQATPISANS